MKLRTVNKTQLRKCLLAIGFQEERGKHHVFFYFRYKGRIVVYTKFSHGGGKEIGQPLLDEIIGDSCIFLATLLFAFFKVTFYKTNKLQFSDNRGFYMKRKPDGRKA